MNLYTETYISCSKSEIAFIPCCCFIWGPGIRRGNGKLNNSFFKFQGNGYRKSKKTTKIRRMRAVLTLLLIFNSVFLNKITDF